MAKFLFGPINKLNGGGQMGRVANRNLITAEQIELRRRLADVNAPENNIIEPLIPPSSPPAGGASDATGASTNSVPTGDGTYQLSTNPSAVIPILYGQCQVRGAVFDSELTNSNTTLTTALMLTERTGDGLNGNADYTLNEVFFNDVKLNLNANGTVANGILNDGTVTTKYNDNTEVYLFQGDVNTPIDKIQPGADATYGSARTFMTNWANTQVQARGTVFALVKQTYDAANGVQGLGTWTFDITNTTTSNPGEVLFDFLTNERYASDYDANTLNANTFIGSDATSLKSIADETRLFTSTIADDNANANIANSNAYPQLVTNGQIGSNSSVLNLEIGNYAGNTSNKVLGNLMSAGNLSASDSANMTVLATQVNRLKVFWANAATPGANCTNIISGNSEIGSNPFESNAATGQNTFTAFLDVGRVIPDGGNIHGFSSGDANVDAGTMFPGDTYDFSASKVPAGANSNVVITQIPTSTTITILTEGDKIRPEGSPFIYTVAENVIANKAGYQQFKIKVKERIVVPDFGNIDMGNATLKTNVNSVPLATDVQAERFDFDNDDKAIYYVGGWPYNNANVDAAVRFPGTSNLTYHANVIRSNLLIGNAVMSSPNTANDSIVLGEEKNMTINGLVKTDKPVQDIQKQLLRHSGSMLNWELPEGRWKIVPNANADISGSKSFDDDNIVGEIKVTTSDITTFYNSARAQYVELNHNSVKEDIIVHTPDYELNTNESKHKMELSYPLCNSASEAQRKADVELKQNRLDKVINFTSDYTGMGIEPGDIFRITNSDYGFLNKTFRAVKVIESMDDDILTFSITGIEWTNETYNDRIPFRKPALDDIEFEPEEYADIVDGSGVKEIPETALEGNIKLGGVLLSKFFGSFQHTANTGTTALTSLHPLYEVDRANLGATIRSDSESFLLRSFMMPQGSFTSIINATTNPPIKGVAHSFTCKTRIVAYVSNATSNVAFTSNISTQVAPFLEGGQGNGLRIDVPKDVSNIKVQLQGALSSDNFNGQTLPGFDEISLIGVRESG